MNAIIENDPIMAPTFQWVIDGMRALRENVNREWLAWHLNDVNQKWIPGNKPEQVEENRKIWRDTMDEIEWLVEDGRLIAVNRFEVALPAEEPEE